MKLARSIGSRVAFGAFLLLACVPQAAEACPYCAQNTPSDRAFRWLLITMILLPFAVAGLVIHLIRRAPKSPNQLFPESPLSPTESPRNPEPTRQQLP